MQYHLIIPAIVAGLLGASATASADPYHRHWHGDRHWDGPYRGHPPRHFHGSRSSIYLDIGPLWWPYYPRYAPSTIVVNPAPTTYVERAPTEDTGYWYYCQSSQAYYPYVKSCPGGWMKVVPDTPDN